MFRQNKLPEPSLSFFQPPRSFYFTAASSLNGGVSAEECLGPPPPPAPLAGIQPPSSRLTLSPPHRLATEGTTHTHTPGPPCRGNSSSWLFWRLRLFAATGLFSLAVFTLKDFQTNFKHECESCRVLLDNENVPFLCRRSELHNTRICLCAHTVHVWTLRKNQTVRFLSKIMSKKIMY